MMDLFDDMSSWEAGDLPLEELERRHSGDGVRGMIALHERMSAVAAEPVPAPAEGWPEVQRRLSARPTSGRARRVVVGALVAAVLTASVAAASPDAVKSVVDQVRRGVHSLLGGEPVSPPVQVSPSPSPSPDPSPTTAPVKDGGGGSGTGDVNGGGQDGSGGGGSSDSSGDGSGDQSSGGSDGGDSLTSDTSSGTSDTSSTDQSSTSGDQVSDSPSPDSSGD
ncbi:MAG: hypothetical protein HY240_08335 [Actinobacteria bacterium]|nr:hypothetical protein [Actinomycetota bacterium]